VSEDKLLKPFVDGIKWLADRSGNYGRNVQHSGGMVIADGRLYVLRKRSKQPVEILARDAYNGLLLWRKEIGEVTFHKGRGNSYWRSGHLSAGNGKVYLYPRQGGPMAALDGKTGEVVKEYANTATRDNSFIESNILVMGNRIVQTYGSKVWVLDEKSGAVISSYSGGGKIMQALVGKDGHFYAMQSGSGLLSLTYPDLKKRWTASGSIAEYDVLNGPDGGYIAVGGNIVRTSDGKRVSSFDKGQGISYMMADHLIFESHYSYSFYDPQTGNRVRKAGMQWDCGGCSHNQYSPGYQWRGFAGLTFPEHDKIYPNDGMRPDCQMHFPIAYGQMFNYGTPCGCALYIRAGIASVYTAADVVRLANANRLIANPGVSALSANDFKPVNRVTTLTSEWENGDGYVNGWKGFVRKRIPTEVYGNLVSEITGAGQTYPQGQSGVGFYSMDRTKSVESGGITVQGYTHENRITAKSGGTVKWHFPTGGRTMHTPIIDGDKVYFGCNNGWVYALKLSDGSLVWKYFAAPMERRMVAFGQVESSWPVAGLTLYNDALIFVAGRRSNFDDGIYLGILDKDDGSLVAEDRIRKTQIVYNSTKAVENDGYYGLGGYCRRDDTGSEPADNLACSLVPFEGRLYMMGENAISPDLKPVAVSKGLQFGKSTDLVQVRKIGARYYITIYTKEQHIIRVLSMNGRTMSMKKGRKPGQYSIVHTTMATGTYVIEIDFPNRNVRQAYGMVHVR
jgi:outer membrane protein assembly factor BamB